MSLGQVVVDIVGNTQPLQRDIKGLRSTLTGGIMKGLTAVGTGLIAVGGAATAAGTAIAGISLSRGFSRLADIEDAEAKLRGLGHSAETVETVMGNALASVRGTAFGLDEAATVAASAVAAGIKPGADLERVLKTVADTSTIAGSSMDEMGAIFNKVAASNRLSMTEVNQLADRGVPILQMLADQFGVTTEEMSKMVSQGKVDFEAFTEALETNISGAALESGDTTRGAFDNMMAAISRVGANLLSGIFPMFKEVLTGITEFLAPIEDVAKNVGEALGAAFDVIREGGSVGDAFATFKENLDPELFQEVTSSIQDLVSNGLQFLSNNAGDIVGILLELRSSIFDAAISMFEGIVEALPEIIPQVVSALLDMVTTLVETLVNLAPALLAGAVQLLQGLVEAAVTVLPMIITAVIDLVTTILDTLVGQIPALIEMGIDLLLALVDGVVTAIPDLIEAVVGAIPELVGSLLRAIPKLIEAGLALILGLIDGIVKAVPVLIIAVVGMIPVIVQALVEAIPQIIQAGIQLVIGLITGLVEAIPELVAAIPEIVVAIVEALIEAIPMLISAGSDLLGGLLGGVIEYAPQVWEWFKALPGTIFEALGDLSKTLRERAIELIQGFWDFIVERAQRVWDWLRGVPGRILSAVGNLSRTLREKAFELIGGFRDFIVDRWERVVSWLKGVPGRITRAIGNLGSLLKDKARELIDGFIGGIRDQFDRVRNTLGNLTDMLPSWKGPASVDRVLLRGPAQNIMGGFADALADEARKSVQPVLRGITSDLQTSIGPVTIGGDGPTVTSPTVNVGGITINVNNGNGRQAGEDAADALLAQLSRAVLVR